MLQRQRPSGSHRQRGDLDEFPAAEQTRPKNDSRSNGRSSFFIGPEQCPQSARLRARPVTAFRPHLFGCCLRLRPLVFKPIFFRYVVESGRPICPAPTGEAPGRRSRLTALRPTPVRAASKRRERTLAVSGGRSFRAPVTPHIHRRDRLGGAVLGLVVMATLACSGNRGPVATGSNPGGA
jgi:hypothetical protein